MNYKINRSLAIGTALLVTAFVGPASATSFNFDFSANDGSGVTASGSFDATLINGGPLNGNFHITDISGTLYNGSTTLLGASGSSFTFNQLITGGPGNFETPSDLFVADNVYYPNNGVGYLLDGYGIAFFVAGDQVALWGNPNGGPGNPDTLDVYYNGFISGTIGVAGSITTSSATPLPSAWTMLIAGFFGLGFFACRGTKKRSAVIAAA